MLKISVIIPVFNVQEYIERCIDSIINQESEDFDIECVLVNDCTPDDSMDIVNRIIRNYCGRIVFKIINHQANQGLSAARNTGIKNSNGDYVLFVDSDDRLVDGALRELVSGLKGVDERCKLDIVVGNSYVCKNAKPAMEFGCDTPILYTNDDETALQNLLNRKIFHTAWNKLVKRNFLLKYDLFFEDGIIDEDLLWSYFLFLYAGNVLVVPRITYIYVDNPYSIMNTNSLKIAKQIKSRIVICGKILNSPPKRSIINYYLYLFYVLTRALNLYDIGKQDPAVGQLEVELFELRDRFLGRVSFWRYPLLYLFFLTAKDPYSKISKFGWYRRYYDRISKIVLCISKMFVPNQ